MHPLAYREERRHFSTNMPKTFNHNNNNTSPAFLSKATPALPTLTTSTHSPAPSSSQQRRTLSTSPTSSTSTAYYLHNTGYGLLEPASAKVLISRPNSHHKRRSSIAAISFSWVDCTLNLAELKSKGLGLGGKISEKLPGLRYSAAFISALRTNLVLSASLAPPSPNLLALTSTLGRFPPSVNDNCLSSSFHPYSMVIEKEADPLADIPDLTFSSPTNEEDKAAGLRLVADILSQQRSSVSSTLIYNPITIVLWSTLTALLYPFVYRNPATDKPNLVIALVGTVMCVLAGVRYMVRPYQELGEAINWDWLGEDKMIIAKFGDFVIGSCVYRMEESNKKGAGDKKMLIRAWTTRPRERRRGVGRGLLEYTVDLAKKNGCSEVEFAPDDLRAGSTRLFTQLDGFAGVLPINRGFAEEEVKARSMLDAVLSERWSDKRAKAGR